MGSTGLGPAVLPSDTASNPQAFLDFLRDTNSSVNVDGRIIAGVDGPILKQTFDTVKATKEKYSKLVSDLNNIKVGGSVNTLASTNGKTLNLNTAYFGDSNTLDLVYQKSVASGFHPAGTTWKDIVTHELGHVIMHGITKAANGGNDAKTALDWNKQLTASKIVHTAMDNIQANFKNFGFAKKPTYGALRNDISGYATKNWHETIAEAWADYSANGDKAKALSKEIYKEMSKYF